jgi:hypothetical protein
LIHFRYDHHHQQRQCRPVLNRYHHYYPERGLLTEYYPLQHPYRSLRHRQRHHHLILLLDRYPLNYNRHDHHL